MASIADLERRIRGFGVGVETDCKMESIKSLIEGNFKVLKGSKGLTGDRLPQMILRSGSKSPR